MTGYEDYGAYKPPGGGKTTATWIAVCFAALALAAVVFWSINAQRNAVHYDPVSLCDVKGPTAVTALLLDATDAISPLQRKAIENRIKPELRRLKVNERLDVFAVGGGDQLLTPVFSKCRPLAPDEVDEKNGNRRLAAERFDKEFNAQLDRQLAALMDAETSARSPIMEAIQAVAVASLQSPALRSDAPGFRRRLIVVSDLLENAGGGNHYSEVPDFKAYSHSPAFAQVKSDLTDVRVLLLYLGRENARAIQVNRHADFWEAWFRAQEADYDHLIPIEG